MTEQEWLNCTDPTPMLEFLRGKASHRKLRLFAVACCRRVWTLLAESRRNVVELTELYADDLISGESVFQATQAWETHQGDSVLHSDALVLSIATQNKWGSEDISQVISLSQSAASAAAGGPPWDDVWYQNRLPELKSHADLLRDIFRDVFNAESRSQPSLFEQHIDPSWLTPTVVRLAEHIYRERVFDQMPILADALEDAECDNQDLLNHCRGEGPHVRGCWVVDLLTGRK